MTARFKSKLKFPKVLKTVFWKSLRGEGIKHKNRYYNDGNNILRLVDNIPNFLFTTSEAKRNY